MLNCVLHTDEQGVVWSLNPNGHPSSVLIQDVLKYYPATNYFILGSKQNYKTIVDLFNIKEKAKTKTRILIGKPTVETSDISETLNNISNIPIDQTISKAWNYCKYLDFVNFQFLTKDERNYDPYVHHCLCPVFNFLQLSEEDAYKFVDLVVDPRWLSSPRPEFRFIKALPLFGLDYKSLMGKSSENQEYILELASVYNARAFMPVIVKKIPSNITKLKWKKVLDARRLLLFLLEHWYEYLTDIQTVNYDLYFEDIRSLRYMYDQKVPKRINLK